MIYFCPQSLNEFFFHPRGCPKRLQDFLSREVPWFFGLKRLLDFFWSREVACFLSWEVAWFFLSWEEECSTVQMEFCGPSKCTKLSCPNGRRSNGLPMLRQFGPSKWTVVQWTAYVKSIWTVQMDDGPMDSLCYAKLDRPNGQRSNGPPMLRKYGLSKWTMVQWTVVHLDGPLDNLYYGNLDRPKPRLWTTILDCPKIRLCTVILDDSK